MRALPKHLLRTLARMRSELKVENLKATTARELQRVARTAVQRLNSRWPGWDRILNPRQRQIVTVVNRPTGRGIERAVDPASLLSDLRSADWHVRARAATRLAQVDSGPAVEGLIETLRDSSAEVALSAVDSLAHRRGARVDAALREVIRNREGFFSPLTRAAALTVLAHELEATDLGLVLAAIRDVDSEVSLAAIEALSGSAPQAASSHLLALLKDQTGYYLPPVRRAAAEVLHRGNSLSESDRGELLETEPDAAIRTMLSAPWAAA